MRLKRLLESRPCTTVWLLEPKLVSAVRRDRKGDLLCTRVALPAGVVEAGSVGLQSVDGPRLTEHLRPLQERVAGARRAAVVIPTAWVRSHLLDFDHLPRRASELTEVVRWRLKKLLPVAPTDLRVAVVPIHGDGTHRVLTVSALERPFADLEAAFAAAEIEPGLVTPRLFALARRTGSAPGPRLVVQHEEGFISLLLTAEGRPHLLRTKPLPPTDEAWPLTLRELHLTLAYIRGTLDMGEELTVASSAEASPLEDDLVRWWSEQEGVRVELEPLPVCPAVEGGELGASRLRVACSVVVDGETG